MVETEQELRKLFGESEIFYDAVFCGKMMIGKIDKDVRAKIEFANMNISKHYDALKVTILNRTEGPIDTTIFQFKDMIGMKNGNAPYFWDETTQPGWYGFRPTMDDYDSISDKLHDYISEFADENIGYEMRTM